MKEPTINTTDKDKHVLGLEELKQAVESFMNFSKSIAGKERTDQIVKLNAIMRKGIEVKAIELLYGKEFWVWYDDLMGNNKQKLKLVKSNKKGKK